MKWPWHNPKATVDIKPTLICSRCGTKFAIDPESYCPECKYGMVVEFVRKDKKKVDKSLFSAILKSSREKKDDGRSTSESDKES